eukprot:TRINITY_DN53009_c0_g1_i1.p1 TRINITY_DN53009_c0_g1~~TRINITY_DN53009_c0_g1_i1.p1  ORF type:complete len:463 (-),score=90.38 TRINITY_DN53009_c0_g1_i1:61-1272(-)
MDLPQKVNVPSGPKQNLIFVAIACGAQFSLALDSSGCVWSWGAGEGGVLGLGTQGLTSRSIPEKVRIGGSRLYDTEAANHEIYCKSVACGAYHAMVLSRDGSLYTWGRAEGGQLGLADAMIQAHIEEKSLEDTCVCEPLEVSFREPGENVDVCLVQAAGGDVHSLAVDTTGQVWSWGWGEFGQLGLGFSASSFELGQGGMASKRPTPQAISREHFGGGKFTVISVDCGGAFSAAIAVEEGSDEPGGRLFLWGANEVGQCAKPAKQPIEVSVPTEASFKGLSRSAAGLQIRSVACGGSHIVALDTSGQALSWGSSQFGQLGSSVTPRTWVPPPGLGTGSAAQAQYRPEVIQSVAKLRIMKAACGLHHTLVLSEISKQRFLKLPGDRGSEQEEAIQRESTQYSST